MFQRIVFCPLRRAGFAGASCRHRRIGGASFQDSSNELSVAVGKTVLVDCVRPTTRVAIGLGDVAEATAISPTEIMVNGKAAGETSLIIWDDRGGRQFFNVTVRASAAALDSSMEAVRRELSTELPGQSVKVYHRKWSHLSARHGEGHDQCFARGPDRFNGRQGGESAERGYARREAGDSVEGEVCERGPQ